MRVGFKRHIFSTLISLHSLLLCGAIFGYFYAWICPTHWGLDQIDPNTAITAMQAMKAAVRNMVFAPVFFATPVVLLASARLAFGCGNRRAAWFYHGRSDLRVWWNGADHGHKRLLEPSPCLDRNALGPRRRRARSEVPTPRASNFGISFDPAPRLWRCC